MVMEKKQKMDLNLEKDLISEKKMKQVKKKKEEKKRKRKKRKRMKRERTFFLFENSVDQRIS